MRSKSTEKMDQIIEYIDKEYFDCGTIPTMLEIAAALHMVPSNVHSYLAEMAERGMIILEGGWRGVRTKEMSKVMGKARNIPIVGEIACGTPLLAQQNIESYIYISKEFLGEDHFFALRAKGDSMKNADIDDGDLLIVRQQNNAEEGQIIVALIDDSATLKRFFLDEKRHMVRLHPENEEMEDMFFDNVDIQGVVIKIIKDCV